MKKKILLIAFFILFTFPSVEFAAADDAARPTVILDSYSVTGGLSAGEDIVFEYTLRNTSGSVSVNNILFRVDSSSGVFYPSQGTSNQYYIGYIGVGEYYTGQVNLTVNSGAPAGVYDLDFTITYQGSQDEIASMSTAGFVTLEVGGNTLYAVELSVPEQCIEGRNTYISVRYTNSSEQELRGAEVILEGNIAKEGNNISIGTVRGGGSGIAEGYVVFQATGEQELVIYLAYEDDGNVIMSEAYTAQTNVMAGTSSPGDEIETVPSTGEEAIGYEGMIAIVRDNAIGVVSGVIAICAIILVVSLVRRRRWKR